MRKTFAVMFMSICAVLLIVAGFPQHGDAQAIYGCVAKNGTLRIVSDPSACSRQETPISWTSVQGLSKAVHGVVSSDGTIDSGTGFTVNYSNTVYYITFDQPFTDYPHCAVTPNTSPPSAICNILGYGPSILDVNCHESVSNTPQVTFSFICVQ